MKSYTRDHRKVLEINKCRSFLVEAVFLAGRYGCIGSGLYYLTQLVCT